MNAHELTVEELTAELRRLYEEAWTRIINLQDALLADWAALNRANRLARLAELRATVEHLMDDADQQATRWTREQLPNAYLLGARTVATVGGIAWTHADLDAINRIAADTYTDLLAATSFVKRSTRDLIRRLTREHLADKLIRGLTAEQAAVNLRRDLEGHGITAVVYKDGSRHGLADYTDMLTRTKTAEAYSISTLNQIKAAGMGWVEVFDGYGCGWDGHDDPDKANGTVRAIDEAMRTPISHPRCVRAFGGRPDVTSQQEARLAALSTTAGQRADQQATDVGRAARPPRFTRRDGLLTDTGQRVASPRHARTLARHQRLSGIVTPGQ